MPLPAKPAVVKRPLSRRAALKQIGRAAVFAALPVVPALGATAAQPPPETEPETPPSGAADAAPNAPLFPDAMAQSLDEAEGYSGWKVHIGKPEDAVCHVRVTVFDGSLNGVTREGSGVVVRCDGFVLVPEALFGDDRALQKTARVALSFRAADGTLPKEPLAPYSPPRYHSPKTDYVLLKVNGHHFKGLHLLDARNFRVGLPVRVVWAAPAASADTNDAAKSTVPTVKTRDATTGAREGGSVPHYGLHFTDADGGVPPLGAVVLDPSSDGVLGIVTGIITASDGKTAKSVVFSPFGYFQYVCNDVGLKVSPTDITSPNPNVGGGGVSSTGQMLGMIKVPGGPTRLKGQIATNYRYFYGTDVVCMPDFFIDTYPVTVGAYRNWLNQVAGARQPIDWVRTDELRSKQRGPDTPIVGVISDDALRYAAGHNKRLPTQVEWARAGVGADVEWIGILWQEWSYITDEQKKISERKLAAYQKVLSDKEQQERNAPNRPRGGSPNVSKTVGIAAPSPEIDFWAERQRVLYENYWKIKPRWFPYQHSPVGFYKQDVSQWKVGDIISNVPEMCQPNFAARSFEPAQKPFATFCDPYFSPSNVYGWLANFSPTDIDQNFAAFAAAPLENRIYVYNQDGIYVKGPMQVEAKTGAGFRCAL